jgi:hypothetical protein
VPISKPKKLTGSEIAPGRYRIQVLVVDQIRIILNIVDHTLPGIRDRGKTTGEIRATLAEKGWNLKRD